MVKVRSIIQKTVCIIVLFLVSVTAFSQNTKKGDNLYIYSKSTGEATVYSMDEIRKITFSKNGIQIWNTNWPTEYAYSKVRVLTFGSRGDGTSGDANGDGEINAADIVEVVNYINGTPTNVFDAKKADANGDGIINGADIDTIVAIIMGN